MSNLSLFCGVASHSVAVQVVVADGERVARTSRRRVKRARVAPIRDSQNRREECVVELEVDVAVTLVTGLMGGLSMGVSPQTVSALNRWRQQMGSHSWYSLQGH